MATLKEIDYAIRYVLQERLYDPIDILLRINTGISRIAAGIKLPDGRVSPPLPDLYTTASVDTVDGAAMASLPSSPATSVYQRDVLTVSDSNKERINPPRGGNYYSFNTFMRRAYYKDLSETGSVYMAAVKGNYLYYQGIPTSPETLLVGYYRKPVDMVVANWGTDTPDGIPVPFQLDLIKHLVLAERFGDAIGRKDSSGYARKQDIHMKRFYEILDEMMQFVGEEEGQPEYYHYGE